ncbi:unnamed protein product [Parnassius mnemosyne]|uniref:FLYWCH-type domain-containing protein n=1 Tax=Parnassius mnemosyne TaxID=213953 RepID=A0AAV1K7N4_9NEOP
MVILDNVASIVEQNGKNVLLIGSNRFMKHYTGRGDRTRWRCCKSFNKCRAIAITYQDRIIKLNNSHNH